MFFLFNKYNYIGDFMRLSELQYKDIVNLEGKKIGNIIDVIINSEGKLISLVLEQNKKFLRLRSNDIETEISWDKIERIGEDVILVKVWYNQNRWLNGQEKNIFI